MVSPISSSKMEERSSAIFSTSLVCNLGRSAHKYSSYAAETKQWASLNKLSFVKIKTISREFKATRILKGIVKFIRSVNKAPVTYTL